MRLISIPLAASLLATTLACSQAAENRRGQTAQPALKAVAAIDLPGPRGKRFDYLEIDEPDGYLLSAHLAAGQLYVIDLKTNQVVRVISGLPGIEGLAAVPELGKVYTSNWYEDKIGVVDLGRFAVVKRLPTEKKPDGIAYAAPFHKIYVSDERGRAGLAQLPGLRSGAVAVVDVRSDKVVTTLEFDSETGVPQYDPVARRVYVNLEDKDELAVIDPSTDRIEARYPVEGCHGNHGMALDPPHRRAFLSCEDNNVLTVFDLDAHRPMAHLPMADGADVVAFDANLGRIYVACSSGAISVFQEDDPDHFRKLEDFHVQPKVHSLAVDPRTHRVYAPEERENGKPVARMIVYEAVTGAKVDNNPPIQ